MRFIKKILERGTVTVPSDVREALGVQEGDIVEFQIVRVVKRSGQPVEDPDESAHVLPRPTPGAQPSGDF